MAKVYKSAMGRSIDIDMVRLANEDVIAIGNMRTNARGDELGAGGKVLRTKAQLMQEYHKLNTPVAAHEDEVIVSAAVPPKKPVGKIAQPTADDTPVATSGAAPVYVKPRGSFAEAVAEETEVKQELLDPLPKTSGDAGVKRI